jgi:hypothetical protein
VDDSLTLQALAAVLADDAMRDRFMALTGYSAATLRARVGAPDVADAVRGFLAGHEPDLIRIANQLGVAPATLLPQAPTRPLCARS